MKTINTLSYAILSALSRKPCSGYDLAEYLEALWPAQLSQIYPLLTKLEQKELLEHEYVVQTGKPNKKIFSITEKGEDALKNWVATLPSDSILRDEFLIKIYSIWLLDEEHSVKLVQDRMAKLEDKYNSLLKKIEEIEKNKEMDTKSRNFGRYLLYSRKQSLVKEEKIWCQWVLDLINKKNFKIPCYLPLLGIIL
ncbi:PadR family transcriptional regulator [Bacillus sp. FJAT-27251]|uniref:PadR family transcriptional regulator n=1 Tax=Bacillus sp. FJAT-27251 TaxID=1684142 RepID=UPI0018D10437|nr:PadR family transcriptional regulator [Bacillus sp. FJAT-27251]